MAVIFKPRAERSNYRWQKFINLGRPVYVEIQYLLMSGKSAKTVADYIQKDVGALKDLKVATLTRYVHAFREQIVQPKIIKAYEQIETPKRGTHTKALDVKLDALSILETQIRVLMKRSEKLRIKEDMLAAGLVLESHARSIKQLTDLAEKYIRIQMDAGLMDKLGNGPLIQINNNKLSLVELQMDIKNRDELALATQEAMAVLARAGLKGLPNLPKLVKGTIN